MGSSPGRARRWAAFLAGVAVAACGLAAPAPAAEDASSFYEHKVLSLYVGVEASSNYALYGRLLGQYLPAHLAGSPTVIVRYMPGAATLVLANYLYNVAPQDGTAIALIHERMGLLPLLDPKGVKYDALKFNWLGAMSTQLSVCFVWHSSSIQTIDDAKRREVLVGGTNAGGSSDVFPRMLNDLLGTKFKVIHGYGGTQEIDLAMERGETEGRCGFGWVALNATKPDWVRDGKIRVLMQMGMRKDRALQQVPLILDQLSDPDQRAAAEFFLGSSAMAYPFVAPPGVPADRVALLRAAFDATVRDPDLLAQAAVQKMDVTPIAGTDIAALLVRLYATPTAIIDSTNAWIR